ncbi:MarR family transcriptional regulator [Corynebacterium uropygiale]|uniref:MarR family transcriptional regulator n=1 Tax=Corynebacterium uropygiale TaxID=1775911 RepID=A0A9X1QTE0_9CORY|nr:MarR family transcriptional regulator [Corynebacterium uropygiale]MCF4007478.1 MarR family transcriptional regulator [Corynebacterium uropygiale]
MIPSPSDMPDECAHLLQSELAADAQFLFARAAARGSGKTNELLAPLGLKVRQYSVLSLAASEFTPTQRDLAFFLGLDPSQVVGIVDHLEKEGLVRRVPDPKDKRSRLITATPKGVDVYRRAHALTKESEDLTLSRLSPGERALLLELLVKIAF